NNLSDSVDFSAMEYTEEIEKLKKVRPHAIITTNYDDLLEKIFDNYQPIVGHNVVTVNYTTYGEIMKIHGSSKEPESIIITNEDYVEFYKRKKYISAKLLTYFVEHPLFFIGYSINDENIKAILSDIDEIIAPNNALIPNIYLVSFSPECEGTGSHQKEILIGVGENKSIRIKVIYANDFGWIYDALSSNTPEISVNPKLVRALLARTYTFASQSLVKQELPYDFEMLKNIAEQDNVLAKLYGIAELNNGQALNASYPYTISELAKLLDMGSWHYVHKVLERIHKETGFNIKSSDNNYHVLVKTGKEGVHKYSPAAFELIKKIINGQKYKLKP
ncbi:TPA: SIR2 family protein, partial [Escherichia coli]|nr:SIR2 family protein [Escherichia coli]